MTTYRIVCPDCSGYIKYYSESGLACEGKDYEEAKGMFDKHTCGQSFWLDGYEDAQKWGPFLRKEMVRP